VKTIPVRQIQRGSRRLAGASLSETSGFEKLQLPAIEGKAVVNLERSICPLLTQCMDRLRDAREIFARISEVADMYPAC